IAMPMPKRIARVPNIRYLIRMVDLALWFCPTPERTSKTSRVSNVPLRSALLPLWLSLDYARSFVLFKQEIKIGHSHKLISDRFIINLKIFLRNDILAIAESDKIHPALILGLPFPQFNKVSTTSGLRDVVKATNDKHRDRDRRARNKSYFCQRGLFVTTNFLKGHDQVFPSGIGLFYVSSVQSISRFGGTSEDDHKRKS